MLKNMNSKKKVCLFCQDYSSDDLKMGKLYVYENLVVHYYCLLFSSGLEQNGRPDDEGLAGFLPDDIVRELHRGKRLSCSYCKKKGATVGCCMKKCRKVFHLPCGQQREVLTQFYDRFWCYCSKHRPKQKIPFGELESTTQCLICFGNLDPDRPNNIIFPTCCRNGVFHRLCVQKQAISSGYFFFRCPLCNNKEKFQTEMQHYGIYIPEQDAAWERENNAFQDLYVRHSRCDVQRCRCPDGRTHNAEDGCWQIVLCGICGSQGCHVRCGNVATNLSYECIECRAVLGKKEKRSSQQEKLEKAVEEAPPILERETDAPNLRDSTTMSLQQFLGGHYALCTTSLIYIESDDEVENQSDEYVKRFPPVRLPEAKDKALEEPEVGAEDQSQKRKTSVDRPCSKRCRISSTNESIVQLELCGPSRLHERNENGIPKKGPNWKRSKGPARLKLMKDDAQPSILKYFPKDSPQSLQQKICVMTFRDNFRPSLRQLDD